MILKNVSIGRRLGLGFGILFISATIFGIIGLRDINKMWKHTENLYAHPFAVSNAVRDININIINIRRYMLNIALNKSEESIERYSLLIDAEEQQALKRFALIDTLYLGKKSELQEFYEMFREWKNLRDEAIDAAIYDSGERAMLMISEDHLKFVSTLTEKSETLINFASGKADEFYREARQTKKNSREQLTIIFIIAIVLSLTLSLLITSSLSKPLLEVVNKIRDISLGKLGVDPLPESKDEIGQLATSYNLMQDNLLHKADIANKIAEGFLKERVISKSDADIVADSINKIADNFEMVRKQAEQVAVGNYTIDIDEALQENQLAQAIIQMVESLREVVEKANQIAQGDYSGQVDPKSKYDELALALNQMTQSLRNATKENERHTRLITAQNDLYEKLRGEQTLEELGKNIVNFLVKFSKGQIGAIYIINDDQEYQLMASYAFKQRKGIKTSFKKGEGLAGQVALEQDIISFSDLPEDYIFISSGLGEARPKSVIIAPFIYNGKTLGVIEIGNVSNFSSDFMDLLTLVLENVSVSLATTINRSQLEKLLLITKEQAEELQVQQEELRQSNAELEAQTQALRKSEEYLQAQQEELRVTNEELQEKSQNLEKQKEKIQQQNNQLEKVSAEIERKANELEITSRYKSEFLANMSHELRTPLNSLLILSQNLAENGSQNLTEDQVESAKIIYNSGNDLLDLINDILDLSKIESGKIQIRPEKVDLPSTINTLKANFKPMADQKKLTLEFHLDPDLPRHVTTDEQRFNQILRNLIGNAIKFTEQGGITVSFFQPDATEKFQRNNLLSAKTIGISVKDTGIGIAAEQQKEIFEAFQQVDGSINRKYGGTGLGLSITRELTRLLHGEIRLISEKDKGSDFQVFLPIKLIQDFSLDNTTDLNPSTPEKELSVPKVARQEQAGKQMKSITDDRLKIDEADQSILVIEDDTRFAEILAKKVHEKGFKCLIAHTGELGLGLVKEYLPRGIILDINLPGMDGWQVLQHLKSNAGTRHIPVHIMSGYDIDMEAYSKGAIGFLTKPITKEQLDSALEVIKNFIDRNIKELLVIEDDDNLRKSICMLLKSSDINISECRFGHQAIKQLHKKTFDCVVLDLGLPDMTGFELLNTLSESDINIPPIVVYTGKDLTAEENQELQQYTSNIIIKGVKSEERLLDETSLFMHRMVDDMPEKQKKMMTNLYDKEKILRDKKVLVVDDDMRNVFAVTKILENARMKVIMAANGEKAIEQLKNNDNIDLILMDIMMPVMDGYEAMKKIREDNAYNQIPIIALTAKAMKEDRQKAIKAGASDYLSKPVDIQKLLNLLQIWLYK